MPLKPVSLFSRRSIRQKILIPFFLILIVLGAGATAVSVLLITKALSDTADERLVAFQETIFREVKKQEILLKSYCGLLQTTQATTALTSGAGGLGILQDQIHTALRDADITVAFYSGQIRDSLPYEDLKTLFNHALRSGRPRFRLITDIEANPLLTVAAPLHAEGKEGDVLVLQTPLDAAFLRQLAAPFNTKAAILSMTGEIITASDPSHHPATLSEEELARIISGNRIFKTDRGLLPHRHLFAAVPLGTTDLIILALELPMADLWYLTRTLATGSVLAITLALLLGGYVYYRLIRQIMAPVKELITATRSVSEGRLDYRIKRISDDELGRMATSFNDMMSELDTLYSDRMRHEKELAVAQEELRHKGIIEKKNQEIEAANKELKAHLKELSALFQLNQAMISTLELSVLFDRILQVLKDVLNCREMTLLLYNPGEEKLVVRKAVGIDSERIGEVAFSLNEGITGSAARSQRILYVRDVGVDERNLNYKGAIPTEGSMVAAPLVVKNRLVGVLNLHKAETNAFAENEIDLIQAVANQAAIAIENARLYEKARNLSNTDELTGLANRRHFQEILKREAAHARRYHTPLSLVMADIDHFKNFNDTHGHLVGDTVLKKVAAILLQNTRGIDLVGRFGGEEFIILLPKTSREGALAAAEKLRACVAAETFPGAEDSQPGGRLTISLGLAEFPTDSKDIYELLDLADKALYQAKEEGRNRTVTWNGRHPRPPAARDVPGNSPL